jgi:hypothetical protein
MCNSLQSTSHAFYHTEFCKAHGTCPVFTNEQAKPMGDQEFPSMAALDWIGPSHLTPGPISDDNHDKCRIQAGCIMATGENA